MTTPTKNPILVEVHRGMQIESQHRGSVIACNADGAILFSAGNPAHPVYPRSALKLFQAIPLMESGAGAYHQMGAQEIALACASHGGEAMHLQAISKWMKRLEIDESDLECGPERPMNTAAHESLIANGEHPTRQHHNCSGKHTAMLATAKFLKQSTRGYSEYQHPTQRAWMQTLGELIQSDIFAMPWQPDGCGLPAICMPLTKLAQAFACFADAHNQGGVRGAAMLAICDAIRAEPLMLAGRGRCCSAVIQASGGRLMVKTGAEGVYGGFIAARGIGFALKIDDGARRAAEVALGALLNKLGEIEADEQTQLAAYFTPNITNSLGHKTGKITPSPWWEKA